MGWREDEDDNECAELGGCVVKAATEKALLVWYERAEHWIPRSVIKEGESFEKGFRGTIMVKLWFAEKEFII